MTKKLPQIISLQTIFLEDRIRHRAYEMYEKRGKQHGNELDDWLEAEKQILEADAKEEVAA